MDNVDPAVGTWALFISAFVSATLAPGGSEAVLAYLVAKSAAAPAWLLVVATTGNTLGALTTWLLGLCAAVGYPVEKLSKGYNQKPVELVRRWGIPALLFTWLPIIGDGLCFAAGWLRLPFASSLLAITVGKALRYAVVIYMFL